MPQYEHEAKSYLAEVGLVAEEIKTSKKNPDKDWGGSQKQESKLLPTKLMEIMYSQNLLA